MLSKRKKNNSESGQVLVLALVLLVVALVTMGTLLGYTGAQIAAHRDSVYQEQGLNIAEAGVEVAIWKLNNQANYSGETNISYGNGVFTATVTTVNSASKLIKVDSYIPNATNPISHRIIQITATVGTTNVGFYYGVEVGRGGLATQNGSEVVGNVFSSGNISGSGTIDNNAVVSEPWRKHKRCSR